MAALGAFGVRPFLADRDGIERPLPCRFTLRRPLPSTEIMETSTLLDAHLSLRDPDQQRRSSRSETGA